MIKSQGKIYYWASEICCDICNTDIAYPSIAIGLILRIFDNQYTLDTNSLYKGISTFSTNTQLFRPIFKQIFFLR